MGPLPTRPMAACQSVVPSLVRSAITLLLVSPVIVTPVAVVNTPALPAPSPELLERVLDARPQVQTALDRARPDGVGGGVTWARG